MSSEIGRTAISTIFKSSYWKSCVDRISSLVEKAQCDSWRQDIGKHTTKQMNRSLFHLQPQPNLLCSSISTSWDLEQKDRWGVPVLSQPRQGRLGCLIKEQIEREKKKKKKLHSLKWVLWRNPSEFGKWDDLGKEWSQILPPLFSSQSSIYNTWAKSGRGSRNLK